MGSEWKEAQLTDLYDISSGLSKPAKEFGTGYPFLAFKDVFNNYFVPDELIQLVQSTEKEQEKCSVKRGDVFLTRTSETMNELGISSVALKDYDRATFNGFTKRLLTNVCNDLVPEFVGYYLRSTQFRNEMLAFSTMSTRASLNNEMIGSLKISFPSTSEQKDTGLTLKKFDDPDEFTFTDEMGWIPKGWEITTVGDEFIITMGQSPPGTTYNELGEGTPFFQGRVDFSFRYPANRAYCTAPKRFAIKGDTLVSVHITCW